MPSTVIRYAPRLNGSYGSYDDDIRRYTNNGSDPDITHLRDAIAHTEALYLAYESPSAKAISDRVGALAEWKFLDIGDVRHRIVLERQASSTVAAVTWRVQAGYQTILLGQGIKASPPALQDWWETSIGKRVAEVFS